MEDSFRMAHKRMVPLECHIRSCEVLYRGLTLDASSVRKVTNFALIRVLHEPHMFPKHILTYRVALFTRGETFLVMSHQNSTRTTPKGSIQLENAIKKLKCKQVFRFFFSTVIKRKVAHLKI